MTGPGKQVRAYVRVLGLCFVLMGVLALVAPMLAGVSAALLVGCFVAAAGLLQTWMGFGAKAWGLTGVLGGVLHLAVGVLILMHPLAGLAFMTLLLAVFFFSDGFLRIATAVDLPKGTRGRGWMTFGGILSGLLAVMMLSRWPLTGTWAIGVFIGVELLWTGMGFLAIARELKSAAADARTDSSTPRSSSNA
jgi:uncharacterized membrane protein HdeD (DUF308 family)